MTSASAFGVQRSRSLSFTVGLLLITFLPLSSVPDPGLERSWGPGHPAGGAGLQNRFGPQFGLKIRGGGGGEALVINLSLLEFNIKTYS